MIAFLKIKDGLTIATISKLKTIKGIRNRAKKIVTNLPKPQQEKVFELDIYESDFKYQKPDYTTPLIF